jgi:aminoglycoside phosphotransferase (APT) family kinase protein
MVLEYIDRDDDVGEDPARDGMAARIAESLRRLHAGPRFHQDFNMFRLVEYYIRDRRAARCAHPRRILRAPADGSRGRTRRSRSTRLPSVPCHNDLLAENYIDDGRQLWIIDFEYSGNNDPCFELGDTAQECEFDEERRAALCEAYFGRMDPVQLARMELLAFTATSAGRSGQRSRRRSPTSTTTSGAGPRSAGAERSHSDGLTRVPETAFAKRPPLLISIVGHVSTRSSPYAVAHPKIRMTMGLVGIDRHSVTGHNSV